MPPKPRPPDQPAPNEPRCDECNRPIADGVAPIWDILLGVMFCSVRCQWRYQKTHLPARRR